MASNEELVASGLRLLRTPLSRFICEALLKEFGDTWWTDGVLETLVHNRMPTVDDVRRFRKLPADGTIEECADAMDMAVCLVLLTKHWPRVFRQMFGADHRGWAYELIGVRNENKHLVGADHPSDYAWRALDTMYRLCESIDPATATDIVALRSSVDLSGYGQLLAVSAAPAPAGGARAEDPIGGREEPQLPNEPASGVTELAEDLSIIGPDFSGADLRKMNFAGGNLAGADFTDADLTDANLKGANLSGAIFKNSSLGNANLCDADLTNAMFEGTALSVRRYERIPEAQVSSGANLTGAKLDGATLNFVGTDLRKAILTDTNLAGADFTDADLEGANLKGAILRGVSLRGANIQNVNTDGVRWT